MALTGLQIQKLLPKTNCKECGSSTCLAFAMKLAAKKAELSLCPYASDEAKRVLGAASEPPVKTIAIGKSRKVVCGGETVLYRHEKTFVNKTVLAVNVPDSMPIDEIKRVVRSARDYALERVGERLTIDMLAVTDTGASKETFRRCIETVLSESGDLPLVLKSDNAATLAAGAPLIANVGGVLCSATLASATTLLPVAQSHNLVLSITADSLDRLFGLSSQLRASGTAEFLLEYKTYSSSEHLQTNAVVRRAALTGNVKPLGYPCLRFIGAGEPLDITAEASVELLKYGGICVLPRFDPAVLAPLLTLRQNIFTDPQKPIQVEPNVYRIGEPGPRSPVFVTTNFSLTYFIVSGEIENSGISAWLVIPDCEGMSVLTAWAAGKFSGEKIGKFVKESKLGDSLETRRIVIPGYVAQVSGELEETLPGWSVMVGPQEAGDIEMFVKARLT